MRKKEAQDRKSSTIFITEYRSGHEDEKQVPDTGRRRVKQSNKRPCNELNSNFPQGQAGFQKGEICFLYTPLHSRRWLNRLPTANII